MTSSQTISDNINKMFQDLFINNKVHPFFSDIKTVVELKKEYNEKINQEIKRTNKEYEYKSPPDINSIDIKEIKEHDELNIKDMNKLLKEINNVLNYNKILNLVSYMSQFMIKSNIAPQAEKKLYENISKNKNRDFKYKIKSKINIMIIGSGPVGLFLACYLHIYYNMNSIKFQSTSNNINIIMYDSRIEKPGFRKPYNRQRLFSTNSKYLNMIIPKLFCWKDVNKDYIMVNIFILEYILYTIASSYNIPMIYEDYSWDDYKDIINKGKFDVVFDCTGGRLSHDAIKITKKNTEWLNNISLTGMNRKLIVDIDKNLVLLENDSKHIDNYFYGSVIFYYKDNKSLIFYKNIDIDINNKYDLVYLNKYKDKYYSYEDSLDIIKGIKDDINRNLLYSLLIDHNYKDYIIEFDVWSIYMRHGIKISDVFKLNNRDILFIGAGDTIFHSHFIVGAGLNRIFDFTVKCANMLDRFT
jgi:hypothetical protein